MPLVPATCTSCGAQLTVDNTKDAAICEYCNTPYIVEKAINNYTISGNSNISIHNAVINVQGAPSVDNLLLRAAEFKQSGNITLALEYYNRVLDIDASNALARSSINSIENEVLEEIPITFGFTHGTLTLSRSELIFATKKKQIVYSSKDIISVSRAGARLLVQLSSQATPLNFAVGYNKPAKLMEEAILRLLHERK